MTGVASPATLGSRLRQNPFMTIENPSVAIENPSATVETRL